MTGVVSLIVLLLVWRFLILFGAAVFEAAGLSPQAAAFEARSAIVGAGYTTSQSECVAQNPAARRVASMLIVTGYFGPATILALLGVSFVVPTSDDLSMRVIVLVVMLAALFGLDRFGAIRAISSRPSKALARRVVGRTEFDTWIVVGDHAVASIVVPTDIARGRATVDALSAPGVSVIAVEPARGGPASFPSATDTPDPGPGDRVVVFGPQQVLQQLAQPPPDGAPPPVR